jgi:hypothetical protein
VLVGTTTPRPPSPVKRSSRRPSTEQAAWIDARDRIGEAIDGCLRTRPRPEMRAHIEALEHTLRAGDHAVGLLR